MSCTSWYDLEGLGDRFDEQCKGIEVSRKIVLDLLESEVAQGMPHNRIALAGFSQGGALALYTGLQVTLRYY